MRSIIDEARAIFLSKRPESSVNKLLTFETTGTVGTANAEKKLLHQKQETNPMPADHFTLPGLPRTPELPADGIYFDMPFETYLAAPAVGSGALRDALADPLLFWSRSWMNPDKEPEEAKDHLLYGRAFHCRILEGPDEFAARYYVEPNKADYTNLIETDDDLRRTLAEFEVKPKSGAKAVRIAQLLELWPEAEIWDVIKANAELLNWGKEAIKAVWWSRFQMAGELIDQNQALLPLVSEGYSEVSLFWHCPRTGIPKKMRVDRLHLAGMLDVKTFANMHNNSFKRAIPKVIANEKYCFQRSHYLEGAQVVRALVRSEHLDAIHHGLPGQTFTPEQQERNREQADFALAWAKHDEPDWWRWLFVQKGDAPTVMAVELPTDGMLREQFDLLCEDASAIIREMAETFGGKPWAQSFDIWQMEDNMIPAYTLEV
jgi:hypothetical protein